MRIVGGALGGRRFDGPKGDSTRPTSERVREALASALASRDRLAGATVLDLYAGTGALAFEALSRGASSALLVERDRQVSRSLERSIEQLGLGGRARVEPLELGSATAIDRIAARATRFDLVFADPPYAIVDDAVSVLDALSRRGVFADDALIVLEHARKHPPKSLRSLASIAHYEYGDTSISFLSATPFESSP